ncbi:hypothetical protein INT45_012226 [Circinella minor]|uniref:BZIP domain-containing protein n=1 Tax=Circinella minor TaxID=1195481 RepID=A0A8H7S0N0_9FUNG|nr:hypothetical protein INT45_012226 [Circinella minor]
MQTNINDNNTLLNNGNENVGTVDSSNSNENSNTNNFMISSSSLSPQNQDDNDITKFLMEAEAFLLNENPPLATTSTSMTDVTEMPMFEIQQFNTDPTPSTPPQHIKNQSEQQYSVTQQQQQQQQMISFFQSNDTHITMVNSNPSPPSTARKVTKSTQRRQANRMKEPIFVTEVPQNAYKKKKKIRSQSSDDEDSDEGAMESKKLSSKQRRQLRNKISARNFRVRRKEYIEQLESQVEEQDKEIEQLKLVNNKLEKTNQELFQELQYWRTMIPTPPGTTSVSSDNNSTSSPPETIATTFPPLDLDQFSLFDFNGDTHLAHAAIPDFDFSQILTDKLLCDGGEEGEALPEDHERDQDGNIVLKPKELIKAYPLFVPALMSMIVRHTFSLHYIAYYTSTLDVSFSDNKTLDLLGQHEWMQQAFNSGNNNSGVITASGNRRRGSYNSQDEKEHMKESNIPFTCEEGGEQEEDDERAKVEAYMRDNYLHYAFWRMCGLSHEQVYHKFVVCYHAYGRRNARKAEEKKEKKRSKANLQRQISTMSAYVTVSNTVLHHPERLPMIASVLKRNSFTKISAQQQRSFLGLPGSSIPSISGPSLSRKKVAFPSLKTIKIGGRRD